METKDWMLFLGPLLGAIIGTLGGGGVTAIIRWRELAFQRKMEHNRFMVEKLERLHKTLGNYQFQFLADLTFGNVAAGNKDFEDKALATTLQCADLFFEIETQAKLYVRHLTAAMRYFAEATKLVNETERRDQVIIGISLFQDAIESEILKYLPKVPPVPKDPRSELKEHSQRAESIISGFHSKSK